jgi:hypothetical protein
MWAGITGPDIHKYYIKGGLKMPVIKKSVSLSTDVIEMVDAFVGRYYGEEFSARLAEIVEDYTAMVSRAKKEVAPLLSEAEWNYLRDMLNGTIVDAGADFAAYLAMDVEDANRLDGLGEKWEIDASALAQKLKSLSFFHGYAIIKAVDEWWAKNDT